MKIKATFIGLYNSFYLYFLKKKREKDLRGARNLPSPVISIGNLTVGGTGKTPMVIALAKEAKRKGLNPCVLSRGYKGRLKGPAVVSCRTGRLLDVIDCGDEPALMADKLYGVPVVIGKDRYEAGMYALECFKKQPDFFLLDDGYQHWRLKRDLDILLISGINPFGNRRLFPFGPLREPLEEIKRADIIVVTMADKCPDLSRLIEEIRVYAPSPIYLSNHRVSSIGRYRINHEGKAVFEEEIAPSQFRGKKVFAFAGIGNPESFRLSLKDAGMDIVEFITFRDHHLYSVCELKELSDRAKELNVPMVTTEKDLIRADGRLQPGEIYTLIIEISIENRFFEEVFEKI
jgi:tetraacyldisaccharide 4'-kinase